MAPLPPEAYELARRNAASAVVTDRLIEDLRLIIWGAGQQAPAAGEAA